MEGRDTGDEEHHVFSAVCSSRPDMLGTGTQGGAPEKGVSKQRLEAQERGGVEESRPRGLSESTAAPHRGLHGPEAALGTGLGQVLRETPALVPSA